MTESDMTNLRAAVILGVIQLPDAALEEAHRALGKLRPPYFDLLFSETVRLQQELAECLACQDNRVASKRGVEVHAKLRRFAEDVEKAYLTDAERQVLKERLGGMVNVLATDLFGIEREP